MKNLVLTLIYLFIFVSIGFSQVTNSENKYDFVGNLHNDAMRYVFERVSEKGEKPEKEELAGWIMEWFNGIVLPGGMNIDERELNQLMIQSINGKLDIKSTDHSSTFSGYYFNLGALLSNFTGNIDVLFAEFKKLERGIIKSDMDEREKGILLIAASVGRHSIYYWVTEGPKWGDLPGTNGNQEFVWGEIGRADMQGAAGGAAGGIVAGSVVVPPFGSIAGWVAGGIGGGCIVSAADILYQVFN